MHAALNVTFGLVVVAIVLWRLTHHFHEHTRLERISLAMIGAGMVLVTPAIWLPNTPFDDWAFNFSRAAFALFLYATFVDRRTRTFKAG